ncbi:MAG: hypothetical protein GF405_00435 [Candidatus Eisenbacteria bacterium]|nr:hypothetical protein [Candidatus Eisenbacteria bacterium]
MRHIKLGNGGTTSRKAPAELLCYIFFDWGSCGSVDECGFDFGNCGNKDACLVDY